LRYLVFSTSLNPDSKSRAFARLAFEQLKTADPAASLVDLREIELPMCDGANFKKDPNVIALREKILAAQGILIAAPVYNYDLSAATKNLLEMTGDAWTGKIVGFLCAAGGQGSYMAPMGLMNSLMLDFRCLVLPRFVFGSNDSVDSTGTVDSKVQERILELTDTLIDVSGRF